LENRLKQLRVALNLTQVGFCKKIKLAQSTWAMIESGNRKINGRHIKLICDEFNVNERWLVDGIGGMFNEAAVNAVEKLVSIYNLNKTSKRILESFVTMKPSERQVLTDFIDSIYINNNILSEPSTVIDFNGEKEKTSTVYLRIFNQGASAGIGNYLFENGEQDYELVCFESDKVPTKANFGLYVIGDSMDPLIKNGELIFIEETSFLTNNDIGLFVISGEAFCKKLYKDEQNKKVLLLSLNPSYSPIEITENSNLKIIGKVLI
jgi:SOS-response transcriptional repressor LexA